jgi:hypothetical protein
MPEVSLSAWKGRAIEQLVAAHCVLASGGALNVSTPMYDDEGVDLVFSLRGQPATLAVQVKSRFSNSRRVRGGSFRMDVKKSTFKARPDLALIGVLYNEGTHEVTTTWVIPSEQFWRLVRGQRHGVGKVWVMRTGLNQQKEDKWSYFKTDWEHLPQSVVGLLTNVGPKIMTKANE